MQLVALFIFHLKQKQEINLKSCFNCGKSLGNLGSSSVYAILDKTDNNFAYTERRNISNPQCACVVYRVKLKDNLSSNLKSIATDSKINANDRILKVFFPTQTTILIYL
jgi:hypothetical protein